MFEKKIGFCYKDFEIVKAHFNASNGLMCDNTQNLQNLFFLKQILICAHQDNTRHLLAEALSIPTLEESGFGVRLFSSVVGTTGRENQAFSRTSKVIKWCIPHRPHTEHFIKWVVDPGRVWLLRSSSKPLSNKHVTLWFFVIMIIFFKKHECLATASWREARTQKTFWPIEGEALDATRMVCQ